jgi:hypothetical protein
MYDLRVERSAGWSGIAFILVTATAAFLPGIPPTPDAPAAEVGAYVDGHRVQWLIAAWAICPGIAFFYWWLVQVRAFLRLGAAADDGLPSYAFAGGVALGIVALQVALTQIVLGFQPSAALGAPVLTILWDAFNGFGALLFAPAAVLALAASHSGRRHASLPVPLVWWGYATAAGCELSTLSIFSRSGFTAMGGVGTFLLGLLPFSVWVIWLSAVLIRSPRGGENPH